MLHCNMNLRGNTAMHLQSLQSGSLIQFDGGGLIGERLQRTDEIA